RRLNQAFNNAGQVGAILSGMLEGYGNSQVAQADFVAVAQSVRFTIFELMLIHIRMILALQIDDGERVILIFQAGVQTESDENITQILGQVDVSRIVVGGVPPERDNAVNRNFNRVGHAVNG